MQRIAFSYTRFSTLAQEQGDSERRQIESARRYATVLTGGSVKDVQGGEGKIIAKLTFINGAVKWAFINKDRAVLMW